jgi:MFS family permease
MYLAIVLTLITHIGYVGSKVAVTLYALELGAGELTVGVLVALYAFCPMLLSIAIGKFVDRTEPRIPMMAGAAGLALALALPALFPGLVALYISALALGFANQVFNIPVEANIGAIGGTHNRVRNYAWLSMAFSAASFIGPVVAGVSIDWLGHRQVFWVLAVFTLVSLPVLCFRPGLLPRTEKAEAAGRQTSVMDLWRIRDLRTTIIIGSIILSAWDLFQFYLPIYGHSIGLSASAIGTILGLVSFACFVIRAIIPYALKVMTEAQMLMCSVVIAAFVFALFPFFVNPYALGVIAFVLGLGVGCATPIATSFIYVLSPPGRIAEAMGLRKTVNQTAHVAIPIVFGSVGAAFGFLTVFMSNALLLAASAVLMRAARLPDDVRKPDGGGAG